MRQTVQIRRCAERPTGPARTGRGVLVYVIGSETKPQGSANAAAPAFHIDGAHSTRFRAVIDDAQFAIALRTRQRIRTAFDHRRRVNDDGMVAIAPHHQAGEAFAIAHELAHCALVGTPGSAFGPFAFHRSIVA